MTYEEYTKQLEVLRTLWRTKGASPSKSDSIKWKQWDTDMELTVRKPCRDPYTNYLRNI